MWIDPIVLEIRALREEYASMFAHDLDAIFQDALRRQKISGKKIASFQPRKPLKAQHFILGDAPPKSTAVRP